jgi:hypothetical protein
VAEEINREIIDGTKAFKDFKSSGRMMHDHKEIRIINVDTWIGYFSFFFRYSNRIINCPFEICPQMMH